MSHRHSSHGFAHTGVVLFHIAILAVLLCPLLFVGLVIYAIIATVWEKLFKKTTPKIYHPAAPTRKDAPTTHTFGHSFKTP